MRSRDANSAESTIAEATQEVAGAQNHLTGDVGTRSGDSGEFARMLTP